MNTEEFQGLLEQVKQLSPLQRQQLAKNLGILDPSAALHRPVEHPLAKRKQVVRKAVFPVAGLGTRFLPATKVSPKEMLPVADKPLIQYAVEEAVAAGIDVMVFIVGRSKGAILDHFDKAYELEAELTSRGKTENLTIVQNIVPPHVTCVYIRQAEALGLGHAVACAKAVIGDEPFAVILADDMIDDEHSGCLAQMVKVFEDRQCPVLCVQTVQPWETGSYGIVAVSAMGDRLGKVDAIIEKPKPDQAPSNLAVIGRYILTPSIFDKLKDVPRGAGGEIQLTDAIAMLLADEMVLAYEFEGRRYDCGSKLGFLTATVVQSLKHSELKGPFKEFLKTIELN
ncbi:UTP--glucose-1-phosphate uridylyltransferase GalU [Methylococcus sp. EFPC2]|uniref:UTP--glucose-1-phosphate uridylyltransferase GalU n=1 Tax=Methylococcus sp. EFPC2 TaxID=2812648 RepID=UPI001966EDD5|nr:UTP--glucose-1-phosphate uridylyltransferase GalU [Methylococcus sp. EFPC2]QSA97770.1 UTP--glucose-1-phosphate uridylyltransferase GalU [Methylococcus sp. EFPC2]